VGRSLGRQVGQRILKKHPHLKKVHGYNLNDFGAIVAAAALAHDIGNPPFGHSGEKAIGDYFNNGEGQRFKEQMSAAEFQDLLDFEGNANGFKILTESRHEVEGGLRLTYATLGAFTKYPKGSLPKRPTSHIADKKFGYFQSEAGFFEEVATDLGLLGRGPAGQGRYCRHPLAYLVEAADDICYTIVDFEDGINLGWIGEELALENLINLVKDRIDTAKYNKLRLTKDRIGYLRSLAIGTLIGEAVEIFLKNEEAILAGTYQTALLDESRYKAQIADIIDLSVRKIYQSQEVRDKEIAGYNILNCLLHAYTQATERHYQGNPSHYDNLLLKNLQLDPGATLLPYQYVMKCCNYVSTLTDGNALLQFQKINGALQ
jgi:dGTPase